MFRHIILFLIFEHTFLTFFPDKRILAVLFDLKKNTPLHRLQLLHLYSKGRWTSEIQISIIQSWIECI